MFRRMRVRKTLEKLFKLNEKYINKYDFKLLGINRINKVDREAIVI